MEVDERERELILKELPHKKGETERERQGDSSTSRGANLASEKNARCEQSFDSR